MYILLNRQNVVVDILKVLRYIKLQSSNNIVIACEEKEGTGVIGSDCDTHYPLIKADTTNNSNAVSVMEVDKIPDGVVVNYSTYNRETGEFETSLSAAQDDKQEQNKALFAEYLANNPLTWTDGKEYGITQEDQSEISLNLNQYQLAVAAGVEAPTLEWHAKHEECSAWTLEDLTSLSLAIAEVVYPFYHQMQQYKTAIYGTTSIEELEALEITYGESTTEEEEEA